MKFSEIVKQALALLQESGRISYGALKLEFDLDGDQVEALKEELLFANPQIEDVDGRGLRWTDDHGLGDSLSATATQTPPPEAERRQITVMFCDLVGSTALSEKLDPEDLRELMQAYQQTASKVIDRYDGHVAQYLGDGLMIYFGWPVAHEEDAGRAVQAALDLIDAVRGIEGSEPLQARIGIATGPVVVGETGAGDPSVPKAAVGETPNLAARLQGLASPNEIVIAPMTYALAGGAFEYDDLGDHDLKGISDPVRARRVVGNSASGDRFEARTRGRLSPLVGRTGEISLLLERWTEAKHGSGQVVLMSGEPGIGKSRIAQELRNRLSGESHTRLRYQCSPFYINTAFYPIIDQLGRAAGFIRDETRESRLDKLEALLAQGTSSVAEIAPLIAALLSLPVNRYAPLDLSPEQQKQKTIDVLAEQAVGLGRKNPVLMIFEDAHWADASTVDLLTAVIERIKNVAMLMVVTYRPEFNPPWSGFSHVSAHSLNRLSPRQGAQLVEMVTSGTELPAEVFEQIIANTDGVPLFVEELTKSVLETQHKRGLHQELAADPAAVVPATLQDSLMARLDRLESGKEIAQIGACFGREFNYQLIGMVTSRDDAGLDDALARLLDAELLYQRGNPPDATYSFKHALIQETAYNSLLKSRRRSIHGQIAALLEAQCGDGSPTDPELLAHHFSEAGKSERAISYWQQAGARVVKSSANIEAVGHFNSALNLIDTLPANRGRDELELNVLVALAVPLAATTGFASEEMDRVYSRGKELCEVLGETPQLFPVLYGLWDFYLVRANYESAHREAEQLLSLVQGTEDVGLTLEAHRATGATLYYLGEFRSAEEHLEVAMSLYDPEIHRGHVSLYRQDPGVACFSYSAWTLWCLGYPQQALEHMGKAFAFANESCHPFSLAWALNFAGRAHELRRDALDAQERADAVITLATEQGFAYWLAWGKVLRGWSLAAQGHPGEGMTLIREGIAAIQATGTEIARSQDLGLLAQAQYMTGEVEQGLQTLSQALEFVANTKECYYESELHRLMGVLTLEAQAEDYEITVDDEAEAHFREAIAIAKRQHAKSWELRAATSLATYLHQQGRRREARDSLSEIYDWFTEGFDTQDLQDAKALLMALD